MSGRAGVGGVVIGRDEGARLIACLDALAASEIVPDRVVYVDSGSTDGSPEAARARGAEVVVLGADVPFTAARARNAGLSALREGPSAPAYVQFVDGDCALRPGWIGAARAFLDANPRAAVAAGRLRERFPEASAYNRLCDREWEAPAGRAKACGGIALMRMAALEAVGGFDPGLVAGEEPELCLRLGRAGWEVWRLDAEMGLHDAAMTRFGQFWARMRRSGHAYAEAAAMHGAGPERLGVHGRDSALFWGLALPAATLAGAALAGPWALAALAAYPAQAWRIAARDGGGRAAWERAALLMLGKGAQAQGALGYWRAARAGRRAGPAGPG